MCTCVCKAVSISKIKTVDIENEQIEGLRTETCIILKFREIRKTQPEAGRKVGGIGRPEMEVKKCFSEDSVTNRVLCCSVKEDEA